MSSSGGKERRAGQGQREGGAFCVGEPDDVVTGFGDGDGADVRTVAQRVGEADDIRVGIGWGVGQRAVDTVVHGATRRERSSVAQG